MNEQGSTVASSVATHLAVSGNGMFVVRGRSDDATSRDPYYYTRAGQFTPDADGYLQNAAGYYLLGWPVDATATVNANPTDLNALETVRVSGIAGGAEATSRLSLSANLQSSQEVSAAAATYDATDPANNMASGAVTPDFQVPIQMYDSQGGLHTLTFSFLKQGPNSWYAEVHLPAGQVVDGAPFVNGQLATGIVNFTPFGQLDAANSTLPLSITIGATGAGGSEWDPTLGLATQTIALDLGGPGAPGGLTNYDSPSVLGTSQIDGTPFGSLASVDVDDDGFVTAIFTNGLTRRIYQIPLATFGNTDGLLAEHGGIYRLGPDAGALSMRGAGDRRRGQHQVARARILHRRSRRRVLEPHHDPARLLGVVEDHHDGRRDARRADQAETLSVGCVDDGPYGRQGCARDVHACVRAAAADSAHRHQILNGRSRILQILSRKPRRSR